MRGLYSLQLPVLLLVAQRILLSLKQLLPSVNILTLVLPKFCSLHMYRRDLELNYISVPSLYFSTPHHVQHHLCLAKWLFHPAQASTGYALGAYAVVVFLTTYTQGKIYLYSADSSDVSVVKAAKAPPCCRESTHKQRRLKGQAELSKHAALLTYLFAAVTT